MLFSLAALLFLYVLPYCVENLVQVIRLQFFCDLLSADLVAQGFVLLNAIEGFVFLHHHNKMD